MLDIYLIVMFAFINYLVLEKIILILIAAYKYLYKKPITFTQLKRQKNYLIETINLRK